ncbi:MAG: methionine--tRNA ligase [Candidatus Nealsonbacteria bacterium CG_4_10_14_0_2_um_filter_38_17]|uniref:Methionine--tRNA ligase n=2 Tax=Candidatus Nealsoniibacteriota TaxID=1817911 RepID=A0A2M7UXH0_9BACT|nr:MAG: methionine--tRNA ligase [Candidatus Nealsonbacteria bacterium CG23_combo_of_CG06-09_8_20_14_all_38_19]PIZ88693.1 MAG: methionine--tRNA ligase [Candidatus Nealsonbacteria bacterium CG_4_10_14_0_2_um_filter_38_17]
MLNSENKFYITTAIDYVNDTIHIGHAFQKVIADVLARYYRIKLGKESVFFLTGTDEYGQKAEKATQVSGVSTKDFVDRIAKTDIEQQDSLNISYDRFIRTTDPDHTKSVQEIWNRVKASGDIYLGEYKGLYCTGCEAYYTEEDLIDGKCPYHPNIEVKIVSEKNYFFKWTKYKDFLIENIKNNPGFIFPLSRANEMLEFAKNIKDIPISRTNFKWGIPVPDDPEQVIYVWFDALTNYITGVGFPDNKELFNKFWPADVHILGKDNVRWHSLLWPAMLKSAGVKIPKTILVNGFLSLNGQKISKSLGNVIRPTDWVSKYGADAVRYYLMRYTAITEDSDISEEKLKAAYNSDLANGLGNLVSRVLKLCQGKEISLVFEKSAISDNVAKLIEEYKLNEALTAIWERIKEADVLVDKEQPWKLSEEKAKPILEKLLKDIYSIAYDLQPFLTETPEKIFEKIETKEIKPLFPRI